MILLPDVEAVFRFESKRKICDGYRPAHLIKDDCLTTGIHHYYGKLDAEDEVAGTITFISPEDYPGCLWLGKEVQMYDGSKLIGWAKITKIFNRDLAIGRE